MSDVQQHACLALSELTTNDAESRLVAGGGGISVILCVPWSTTTNPHHERDVGVQQNGCGALARLACWNAENKKQIGASQGISVVVGAMKRHKSHVVS